MISVWLLILRQADALVYRPGLVQQILKRGNVSQSRRLGDPQKTVCKKVDLSALQAVTSPPFPSLMYQYAGYLSVGSSAGSALGFIFSGAQSAKTVQELATKPIILWMNGGPGSSSQLGNFYELGRVRLTGFTDDKKYKIDINNFAWDQDYSIIFLDQPLGTGLSNDAVDPSDFTSSVAQSTEHLYHAINQMFTNQDACFGPQQLNFSAKATPFFIFGESYAGKYAPALGSRIIDEINKKSTMNFTLKGVAVGDGFTDPKSIVLEMPQFASSAGLLSKTERQLVERSAIKSFYQIKAGKYVDGMTSFYQTLDNIVKVTAGVNVYDIRMYELNTDDSFVQTFLSDPLVRTAYNFLPGKTFSAGSDEVFARYADDFMRDGLDWVKNIIAANMSFMAYNGQVDLIVQTPGTLRWVQELPLGPNWASMPVKPVLNKNKKVIGYSKETAKFRYLMLNQAGHLVPMDQPEAAKQLVDEFVSWSLK